MTWDGRTERRKNSRDTENLTKAITAVNAELAKSNAEAGFIRTGIKDLKESHVRLAAKQDETNTHLAKQNSGIATNKANLRGLGKSVDWNKHWIYGIVISFGLCGLLVGVVMWGPRLLAGMIDATP